MFLSKLALLTLYTASALSSAKKYIELYDDVYSMKVLVDVYGTATPAAALYKNQSESANFSAMVCIGMANSAVKFSSLDRAPWDFPNPMDTCIHFYDVEKKS